MLVHASSYRVLRHHDNDIAAFGFNDGDAIAAFGLDVGAVVAFIDGTICDRFIGVISGNPQPT